jgi:hypothetical protein
MPLKKYCTIFVLSGLDAWSRLPKFHDHGNTMLEICYGIRSRFGKSETSEDFPVKTSKRQHGCQHSETTMGHTHRARAKASPIPADVRLYGHHLVLTQQTSDRSLRE